MPITPEERQSIIGEMEEAVVGLLKGMGISVLPSKLQALQETVEKLGQDTNERLNALPTSLPKNPTFLNDLYEAQQEGREEAEQRRKDRISQAVSEIYSLPSGVDISGLVNRVYLSRKLAGVPRERVLDSVRNYLEEAEAEMAKAISRHLKRAAKVDVVAYAKQFLTEGIEPPQIRERMEHDEDLKAHLKKG